MEFQLYAIFFFYIAVLVFVTHHLPLRITVIQSHKKKNNPETVKYFCP